MCFGPICPSSMFPCAMLIHDTLDIFQVSHTSFNFSRINISRQLMKVMELILKFRQELITSKMCRMSIVTTNKHVHLGFNLVKVQFLCRIYRFSYNCEFYFFLQLKHKAIQVFHFFSTKVELVLIGKRKYGERSNKHNSRKCESKQNNFCGNLHS